MEDEIMRDLVIRIRQEIIEFIKREDQGMKNAVQVGHWATAAYHKAEADALRDALRCVARACSRSIYTCHLQGLLDE